MRHLAQIIDSAAGDGAVLYRGNAYGVRGVQEFLRDVLAMANAPIEGPRHIIVGAEAVAGGSSSVNAVSDEDFGGTPDYAQLVRDHIEPAIPVSYEPSLLEGKQVGVFEIDNCRDRPYMLSADYSEALRRGDAYLRVNGATKKMGRAELQALFEQRFHASVSAENIQVGFAGNTLLEHRKLACGDLAQLPSAVATRNLEEMMKAQAAEKASGSTSMVARLAHARLYGPDDPYVSRSPEELMLELDQVGFKYAEQDKQFLYGAQAQTIQVMVQNHGSEAITDTTLLLLLPKDTEFFVAGRPPSGAQSSNDKASYPTVTLRDNVTRIEQKIGEIPAGEPIAVFKKPLRVFAGTALCGRKFGLRYALHGQNLRTPAKGRLRLLFGK